MRTWMMAWLAMASMASAGCGGDESDADMGAPDMAVDDMAVDDMAGTSADAMVDDMATEAQPFDDAQAQALLTGSCGGCHIGGGMEAGLALDDVMALIGAPSSRAGIPYIDPGDHANSYIWMKMDGEDIAGARMPLRRQPVPEADRAAFAGWLDGL